MYASFSSQGQQNAGRPNAAKGPKAKHNKAHTSHVCSAASFLLPHVPPSGAPGGGKDDESTELVGGGGTCIVLVVILAGVRVGSGYAIVAMGVCKSSA
mmetsp:Transcript_24306/g.27270  ORF Transcript_24306/g.27270 Transcript_24306/m.27270 type:complete len:98 (-) Transcript_24306:124-417(-)